MPDKLFFSLGLITLIICMYLIFMTEIVRRDQIQMIKDCKLAEISPDFSNKERQMCRMLHGSVK